MTTDTRIDTLRTSITRRGVLITRLQQQLDAMDATLTRIENRNYR